MGNLDLTVIIATYNRGAILRETLTAILSQRVTGVNWELIVVDNGSQDDTPEILRDLSDSRLTALRLSYPGRAAALNAGLERAGGRYILFTDDDIIPSSAWLQELVDAAMKNPSSLAFCGPIIPKYPASAPKWLTEHSFKSHAFAHFPVKHHPDGPLPNYVLPFGPNFMVHSTLCKGMKFRIDLGSSDKDPALSCDDVDFAERIVKRGFCFFFLSVAVVQHRVRPDQLTAEWLQRRAYNLGRSVVVWRHPQQCAVAPNWLKRETVTLEFDRKLLVNYYQGQMDQCRVLADNTVQVQAHLEYLLERLR